MARSVRPAQSVAPIPEANFSAASAPFRDTDGRLKSLRGASGEPNSSCLNRPRWVRSDRRNCNVPALMNTGPSTPNSTRAAQRQVANGAGYAKRCLPAMETRVASAEVSKPCRSTTSGRYLLGGRTLGKIYGLCASHVMRQRRAGDCECSRTVALPGCRPNPKSTVLAVEAWSGPPRPRIPE